MACLQLSMNKTEILRYLRTNSKTQDEAILSLVDRAMELVESTAMPRTLYRIYDCTVTDEGVNIGDCFFRSKRLADNMAGCSSVVVFGATLGTGIDRIIKANTATDIAMAMALQAAAASKIEEVCDDLEQQIITRHGVTLRQRYSPGYFDLDISQQRDLFSLLELTKRIGLTLTDTCEMVPTKSVTAFIGID
ncbi:MAG: vitamin B12 dependent-methionine synthase activation domain-containing protein [Eubacterium sp.]